jgi:hypothetical protein
MTASFGDELDCMNDPVFSGSCTAKRMPLAAKRSEIY